MLKLAGYFMLVVMLVMLNSCLKRPEMRAPRADQFGKQPPEIRLPIAPTTRICSQQDANKGLCDPKPREPIEPPELTEPAEPAEPTEPSVLLPEPIEADRSLASINVKASCGKDSDGCLYRKANNEYSLKCEIKGGGCDNGLLVEVKTNVASGSPQMSRAAVCKDGNKTVADLSAGKIKLACQTDRKVVWGFTPKEADLSLTKQHLEGKRICVITNAGMDRVVDFDVASFSISVGECLPPAENQIRFNMQLEFSW